MVKVHHSKGIANQTGPESCVAHREGRREALTGEPAGQPSSHESAFSVQGADAVSPAEGHTNRCDTASACSALRGREPLACRDALCARTGSSPAWPLPPEVLQLFAGGLV